MAMRLERSESQRLQTLAQYYGLIAREQTTRFTGGSDLEKRIVLGDSIAAISRALGRSRTTIYTELKRGTVIQIRQSKSQLVYLADSGQATYERQRVGSFNTMRIGAIESFINWIESKTLVDRWSFDAAVGYAKHKGLFVRNEMVCTKTLYNYLHKCVLGIRQTMF